MTGVSVSSLPTTKTPVSAWIPGESGKRRKLATPSMVSTAESMLGKWAATAAERLTAVGWERMVSKRRGVSYITAAVESIPHKAARPLQWLALPMGWVESPPYFTIITETACDLANAAGVSRGQPGKPHRLEGAAASLPDSPPPAPWPHDWTKNQAAFDNQQASRGPLAIADVYVDDFLLVAQTKRQQQRLFRITLESIDQVLRPLLAVTDPSYGTEPTLVKKLRQGDAHWSTQKTVLGWDLDTVAGTLQLPPRRVARLQEILGTVQPPRKRMALREWHRLLGELRSMGPGLPGSRGLFSLLQDALSRGDQHCIRLNKHVFACIDDFKWSTASLGQRPTRLRELIPVAPSDVGACDARYGWRLVRRRLYHTASARVAPRVCSGRSSGSGHE